MNKFSDIVTLLNEHCDNFGIRPVQIVHLLEIIQDKLRSQALESKVMENYDQMQVDLAYSALLLGASEGIKTHVKNEWGLTQKELDDMFEKINPPDR